MTEKSRKTEADHLAETREAMLSAAMAHVPFDGWSACSFAAALDDSGVDPGLARLCFPRGVLDLALAFHRQGDARMVARMQAANLGAMRYSARVAAGVRYRIEAVSDKEVVRRGVTFFAMPAHAAEGAAALWGTADLIWKTLGDRSDDLNWYTKRAILSAVYSSTLLYWLGDDSKAYQATWEFLDRRIENVMQFEKFKSGVRGNPFVQGVMRGPGRLLGRIKAPQSDYRKELPGFVTEKR